MNTKAEWQEEFRRVMIGDEEGEAYHGHSTVMNLKGITADQAAARPMANAHTIWELVCHLAAWVETMSRSLEGKPWQELNPVDGWYTITEPDETAWQAALQRLEKSRQQCFIVLGRLNDPEVERHHDTLRFLVHHELYHSGQIGILRKSTQSR